MRRPRPRNFSYLTASDIAKMLDVSPAFIHTLKVQDRLPGGIRIGKRIRWERQAVLDWIYSNSEGFTK